MPMITLHHSQIRRNQPAPAVHAAVHIHDDGSGSLSIYANGRLRGKVSLLSWAEWEPMLELLTGVRDQLNRQKGA